MLDKYRELHYDRSMNRLPIETRAKIIGMLVEGNSLQATSRLCDVSINTVTKLLVDIGEAAIEYHHRIVRNLHVRRLQCDEIWCFVSAKPNNVSDDKKQERWGDTWTWTAIDADTKLCVSYLVGGRDAGWAYEFMQDCADWINGRVRLTTDGNKAYLEAVEGAFGMECDYAQLQKIYGAPTDAEQRSYNPATCIGADMKIVSGDPDPNRVSTSFVERPMRISMRRFTQRTHRFSKKINTHAFAVALHFIHYNFARIHKTLRVTPARAAGISDHVWSLEEIALLAKV